MNKVILSVLGHDRPGIIATVSSALLKNRCNIENISQTILQSEFAGILIVSMPPAFKIEQLTSVMRSKLSPLGLQVHIKPLTVQEPPLPEKKSQPFVITTMGADQMGLVAHLTAIIAAHNVNVTNLHAMFKGGPNPLDNVMIYEVDIPAQTDHQALCRDLRAKARELGLEISIQHRRIFEVMHSI